MLPFIKSSKCTIWNFCCCKQQSALVDEIGIELEKGVWSSDVGPLRLKDLHYCDD